MCAHDLPCREPHEQADSSRCKNEVARGGFETAALTAPPSSIVKICEGGPCGDIGFLTSIGEALATDFT